MNRQIRLVGLGIMALFVVLFVQLNYLQVVRAPALDHSPLNGERVVEEYNKPRGAIVSADGVTLAQSVRAPKGSQFSYRRLYPTGSLFGQITGYYSFIYGSDGVEKTYDSVLTGADDKSGFPTDLSGIRRLLTKSNSSQNVTLTLSDKLQTLARTELAGRNGSVVALDPSTGAILSMYSNPSYDPSELSQLSTARETAAWKRLLAAPGNPLSPGSYRNRWFPGSTFKVITSAAVYDHDPVLATRSYPVASAIPLPETTLLLHNFGGEACGGQLPELLTVSCDTGFGQVGLDLGARRLADEARSFGFDQTPPLDLPDPAQSFFPAVSSFARNLPTLAFSAIGQEDVSSTPLEMAEVAGAIADHGTMMTPHVLAKVTNAQGAVVSTYKPTVWRRATSAATAGTVTRLMESVVDSPDGTGVEARIPGVEVAAKTGTAQTGTGKTDDWFIAFAPAAHPTIAVAVLLPDQGAADDIQGGTLAAPIARAMIEAYLAGGTTTAPTSTTTTPATTPPPSATTTPGAPGSTTPPAATVPATTAPANTAPANTAPATTAPVTTPSTPPSTAATVPVTTSPPTTPSAAAATTPASAGGG
jgi:peptidoglycan glycosyltransferase